MQNNLLNLSVWLCLLGGIYGLWVLFKDLHAASSKVVTQAKDAMPILIGIIAWLSASFTFYVTGFDSPVDVPRILMIVSWCWLAKQYRANKCKHRAAQ